MTRVAHSLSTNDVQHGSNLLIKNPCGKKVCYEALMELDATGKSTNFYKACLEHYNGLPVIEQSEYPANYAMDLQGKINSSSSEEHPESLLDIFFKEKFSTP